MQQDAVGLNQHTALSQERQRCT